MNLSYTDGLRLGRIGIPNGYGRSVEPALKRLVEGIETVKAAVLHDLSDGCIGLGEHFIGIVQALRLAVGGTVLPVSSLQSFCSVMPDTLK